MRCDRCGYAVPEWLWLGDDHPIIINQEPTIIRRTDDVSSNTMKIIAESHVAIKMCKDVNPDQPSKEALRERRLVLAAREVLLGGTHEGSCTNEDNPWISCEKHAAKYAVRKSELEKAIKAYDPPMKSTLQISEI